MIIILGGYIFFLTIIRNVDNWKLNNESRGLPIYKMQLYVLFIFCRSRVGEFELGNINLYRMLRNP